MGQALAGVRVLDLTWVLAGPQVTRILGDFGAEVIKVESRANVDEARLYDNRPITAAPDDVNAGTYFIAYNRSKKSITLNLRNEKGLELLRRLVAVSDVVIENFAYGVMERWGLDYEGLRAIKSDIIYASMAGFGQAGPTKQHVTYGPTVQALSGLTFLGGLPGQHPSGFGHSFMDHMGGYNATFALLMALYHRNRTGEGQHVDLSQVQAAITLTGPYVLDYTVNGRRARRPDMPPGNEQRFPRSAPHNVYRCQQPNSWVAIAVTTDEQWAALRRAMGDPEWTRDPAFDAAGRRFERRVEIDAGMSEWTSGRDGQWIMGYLQRHGVPAAAVQSASDIFRDSQLAAREGHLALDQPVVGTFIADGIPPKLSRTPGAVQGPAPLLGEHQREVLQGLLGVSDDEYTALDAGGAF